MAIQDDPQISTGIIQISTVSTHSWAATCAHIPMLLLDPVVSHVAASKWPQRWSLLVTVGPRPESLRST